MMKNKSLAMLAMVFSLAGCDYIETREARQERGEAKYRAAMVEYSAGRLDAAIKGFEAAIKANPANASARFQLGCLLQDSKHDYLGAVSSYREFLLLSPDSEKASMAKSRLSDVERMLANQLAKKYRLGEVETLGRESEAARNELKAGAEKLSKLESENGNLQARINTLLRENERLRRLISADETDQGERPKMDESVRSILDGDEDVSSVRDNLDEAKRLAAEADGDDGAAPLKRDPSVTPSASDSKVGALFGMGGKKDHKNAAKANEAERPRFYVVQDGDTLYKIALKFYGTSSAWMKIREANKTTVTTDGRVRAGQKLVLP